MRPLKIDVLKVELSGKINQPGGSDEKVTIYRDPDYFYSQGSPERLQEQARANTKDQFRYIFEAEAMKAFISRIGGNEKIVNTFMSKPDMRGMIMDSPFIYISITHLTVPERITKATRA